jgi:hypothetical protein
MNSLETYHETRNNSKKRSPRKNTPRKHRKKQSQRLFKKKSHRKKKSKKKPLSKKLKDKGGFRFMGRHIPGTKKCRKLPWDECGGVLNEGEVSECQWVPDLKEPCRSKSYNMDKDWWLRWTSFSKYKPLRDELKRFRKRTFELDKRRAFIVSQMKKAQMMDEEERNNGLEPNIDPNILHIQDQTSFNDSVPDPIEEIKDYYDNVHEWLNVEYDDLIVIAQSLWDMKFREGDVRDSPDTFWKSVDQFIEDLLPDIRLRFNIEKKLEKLKLGPNGRKKYKNDFDRISTLNIYMNHNILNDRWGEYMNTISFPSQEAYEIIKAWWKTRPWVFRDILRGWSLEQFIHYLKGGDDGKGSGIENVDFHINEKGFIDLLDFLNSEKWNNQKGIRMNPKAYLDRDDKSSHDKSQYDKPKKNTFYDFLGIKQDAKKSDIRRAYLKLALRNHPDKGGDPKNFREIQEAYETLSDEKKRREYDTNLQFGIP